MLRRWVGRLARGAEPRGEPREAACAYTHFVSINELSFLILTALADEPRHGYAILREVESLSGGSVTPQVATLYRTVDRLAADGRICEHGTEVVDGRFRRLYRLTDQGAIDLAAEAAHRAASAEVARSRLQAARPDLGIARWAK